MYFFRNALLSALFLGYTLSGAAQQPAIDFSARSQLIHQPLSIQVRQLPARERVLLTLDATDADHNQWHAEAIYVSDAEGKVDLRTDPAVDGDYLGVRPMGLFWSMRSEDDHQIATQAGYWARLSVVIDGRVVATDSIERISSREYERLGMESIPVREDFIADFYLPSAAQKVPAIIYLGGSGGGFRQERSSLLASEGFAVLNVKYFRFAGLPEGIIEIPLEYIDTAVQWLKQHPRVDSNRIGIIGRSRGSELAMLYAAHYEGLRFVVAEAPSNVVWFGWADGKSSWSYQGEPFPYAEYTEEASERIERELAEQGLQYRDGPKFASALSDTAMMARAVIPVEAIGVPLLLISGKDDLTWPATEMANRIVKRLQQKRVRFPYLHLAYEAAGHNFGGGGQGCGYPNLPPEDYSNSSARGGTVAGNALAAIRSWEATLAFIRRYGSNQ